MILAPVREPLSKEELRTLLREINQAEESDQEFLSDQVYYFDVETGCLKL